MLGIDKLGADRSFPCNEEAQSSGGKIHSRVKVSQSSIAYSGISPFRIFQGVHARSRFSKV